jgi:hypothetical protein
VAAALQLQFEQQAATVSALAEQTVLAYKLAETARHLATTSSLGTVMHPLAPPPTDGPSLARPAAPENVDFSAIVYRILGEALGPINTAQSLLRDRLDDLEQGIAGVCTQWQLHFGLP